MVMVTEMVTFRVEGGGEGHRTLTLCSLSCKGSWKMVDYIGYRKLTKEKSIMQIS